MSTATAQRANAPPSSDIDPFSAENILNPYPFHAQLRAAGPIVYLPKYECYAVGRYVETQLAFSDWKNFCSGMGTGLGHIRKGTALRAPGPIVEADPPDHTAVRSLLNRILSPKFVRIWRESFEAEADRLVKEVVARKEFDGVHDIVEPFVLKVFPDALGIGNAGRENLLAIGDLTGNALGPLNDLFLDSQKKVEPLLPWFNSKFEREAMLPGGFGAEVWAAADAGKLEQEKVMPLLRTFLRGGTDTVISGISSALWLFAAHPDQWAILHADPSLARIAFEEVLRMETPAQSLFRTTIGAFEFAGYQLEDDVKVLCSLAAANRDPEKWPNPDKFDITRSTIGQLALGTGIHTCVGQMIARLEAESILQALVRHVDTIELAGTPHHRPSNTARRLDKLPLRVKLRAS